MKGIHKYKLSLIPLGLLVVTLLSGYFLSNITLNANAVNTKNSNISLHVGDTCSLSGNIEKDDSEFINGQEREAFHILSLSTFCNDNDGYSLYAVGYSGTQNDLTNTAEIIGRTDLIGATTGNLISTGVWADRNTGDNASKSIYSLKLEPSGTTNTATILNGFNDYIAVPSTETKVASYGSNTAEGTNSVVKASYAAKIANVQASDTYTGQVKYTMVHPSSNTATGFTFDDAFQLAGKTKVSGTAYYAMQDMNAVICNRVTESTGFPETQLIDIRDNKVYTVKKINGLCWMTQNLAFTGTTLTPADSNVASNTTMTYYSLDSNDVANHCDTTNGFNYACIKDSGNATTGVWYNYAAASAGSITGDSNINDAYYSVCPKGWKLPTGAANAPGSDFYGLLQSASSSWVANTYLEAFDGIIGGAYSGGTILYSGEGYWWSATAFDASRRYSLGYNSTQFRSDNNLIHTGRYVRCIADMTMQGFTQDAADTLAINETLTLRDIRDNEQYTVGKLRDGKVWMTSNLNLTGGTEIESTKSDVASDWTLPVENGFQEGNRLPESTNTFSSMYNAYVYNTGNDSCETSQPCFSVYSYTAATAGSNIGIIEKDENAPYSICPKGWKLPTTNSEPTTESDFYNLAVAYGMSEGVVSEAGTSFYEKMGPGTTPNFIITGRYDVNGVTYGGRGFYQSATNSSTNENYALSLSLSDITTTSNPYYYRGSAVRCMLR